MDYQHMDPVKMYRPPVTATRTIALPLVKLRLHLHPLPSKSQHSPQDRPRRLCHHHLRLHRRYALGAHTSLRAPGVAGQEEEYGVCGDEEEV